jgi:putative pyruvate formate lyase activating enzyme
MSGYGTEEIKLLSHCTMCPHQCRADRFLGRSGFCKSDAGFAISSICVHKGEEPVISGVKGICNIFFSHCNLQCIYCQNYEISDNNIPLAKDYQSIEDVIEKIIETLNVTENVIGFVSPSQFIPQVITIIRAIRKTGRRPVTVYNTNGYDSPESLKMLEEYIDVYLTDFKYSDAILGYKYSGVRNYPEVALAAHKEIYRQKGANLLLDNKGIAISGIIIRHLILPGAVEQSIHVLRSIAEEISPALYISLMSQYYPTSRVKLHPELNRNITMVEYEQVLQAMHDFGFYRGWTQDIDSNSFYRPDFSLNQPF